MLVGFESIKSYLFNSYQNHTLHHAIILSGKKGIGKASFIEEFCLSSLNTKNKSTPDLLIIKKESEKKEISIDKVRKISNFINQTPAISQNKFIIIDSACELNKSSANALLKILEEPHPNNFLILISHNIGRILPTIKSRCQLIKVTNLSFSAFYEALLQKNINYSTKEIEFLAEICDNSPAEALNFGSDLLKTYQLFLYSVLNKKLEEDLIKKISEKNFNFIIFEKIFEFLFNRLVKLSQNIKINFFFDREEEALLYLTSNNSINKIFTIIDENIAHLYKVSSVYLDKKLCITNIFNRIIYE